MLRQMSGEPEIVNPSGPLPTNSSCKARMSWWSNVSVGEKTGMRSDGAAQRRPEPGQTVHRARSE